MSSAAPQAADLPYARKGDATSSTKPVTRHLTPTVHAGPFDVSDLHCLTPDALRQELIRRAHMLIPLLQENATRTESERRVVDDNIAAIAAAGLLKITVPRRFGGLETDMRTFLDVSRELAKGCGSTAWVVTLLNVCAWFAGLGGAALQDDIWGKNPEARIAGVFSPSATSRKVDGGFIVSGKWPWASGCLHADWAFVGIPVVDAQGAQVDQGFAVFPMAQAVIEDSWYVAGMQGTGSNTIVAEDVFIPDHHIMSVPALLAGDPPTPYRDEALYHSAFVPVATLALAGPQLGLCTRALDYVLEKAPKRGISYTFYDAQIHSPSFQLAMANAATTVDIAHLLAYRAAETIDKSAHEGRQLSYLERARVRMDVGKAVSASRDAIDILLSAHGAGSFAEINPMQRIWRDSETASRHAVISPSISAEVYGRALLGIEEGVTALV